MDLIEALETRRSVRHFKPEQISDELLWNILKLGNTAPSAGNLQAREFIVVRDGDIKERLAAAAFNQRFVREAPVVIVVCGNKARSSKGYGTRGEHFYSIQDADAAIMHIILSAHSLRLGTCWVGAFDDERVSSVLNLPNFIRPVAIIPLGFPTKIPEPTSRMKIEKLVHFDQW
jgi:nitroreductase